MDDKLNDFGKILINQVRYNTINSFYKMIDNESKSATGKKVSEKMLSLSSDDIEIVIWLIPEIVDVSLHNMLFMIEENDDIELLFENENLKEISDGLAGELYTEDGWIDKFSK